MMRGTSLAIFGKVPQFKTPLFVTRPYLPHKKKLKRILDELYESRILTNNGIYARRLEERLADLLHVKYAVLTPSATLGLQLLVKALELKGKVLVPSFTFIASVHSLKWEGLEPVFIDIEPDYFTINPDLLEKHFTKNTSAVMGVHIFGNPVEVETIERFCRKKNVHLIFDAAQALGSFYKDRPVGSFGIAEVFSLHATKIINTLEGGVITTNDSKLYRKIILMRNFGFSGYDRVECLGINAKMNEFCAAVGLLSLDNLPRNIESNKENHRLYATYLRGLQGLRLFRTREECSVNYHGYPILVTKESGITRDRLCDILWKENIIARRYYYPACHLMRPYNSLFPHYRGRLPVTEKISKVILCLPCYPEMKKEDIRKIAEVIRRAFENEENVLNYYSKNKIDSRLIIPRV